MQDKAAMLRKQSGIAICHRGGLLSSSKDAVCEHLEVRRRTLVYL